MLFRPKSNKQYTIVLDKVRHEVPPFIWLDLDGDLLKLWNRFTGTFHLFENGEDHYFLSTKSLYYLYERIKKDFEEGDKFRDAIKQ